MKIIKYIFLTIISGIILGCGNPKFYDEMRAVNVAPRKVNITDKSILKKLRNELKQSNHIIYIHMGGYALSWTRVDLVFDVDNNKYYRAEWNEMNPEITETSQDNLLDCYELYILQNFLDGNEEQFIYLGYNISGGQILNCIYDIDLVKKDYKEFCFLDFGFLNGKPITKEEIIWD